MKKCTLDTNILTAFFKNNPRVVQRFKKYLETFGRPTINIISYYEILRGFKDLGSERKIQEFRQFIEQCEIVSITSETIEKASEIYVSLKKTGTLIGDADILIAAIALTEGLVLVTDNVEHFKRVKDLKIENWMEE